MKPAITTGFNYKIPFYQEISMIRQAGFEVVSLGARPTHSGYDTAEGRKIIRKIIEQNGIQIDSVHAPFPEGDKLFSIDENERLESINQCKLAIDAALEIGGKIVVIHLISYGIPDGDTKQKMIEQGFGSVKTLTEHAIDKNVKLALENGQKQDYDSVLSQLLIEFSDVSVGFCYDSGHENVQGACFNILEKFGHRLLTTHLHDNLGSDTHLLPYEGNIDWKRFREIVHSINYSGNLLLESDMKNSKFREPEQFLSEARRQIETLLHAPDKN